MDPVSKNQPNQQSKGHRGKLVSFPKTYKWFANRLVVLIVVVVVVVFAEYRLDCAKEQTVCLEVER